MCISGGSETKESLPDCRVLMWVLGRCGAELTVAGCNCLPQYNYTVPETGLFLDVRNGSCIRPHKGALPWCIVDPRTCIGKHRLLPDGQAWDSCAIPDINSAPPLPGPCCIRPLHKRARRLLCVL